LNRLRLKGAAEPRPDDPDNHREDEIQVTRVPDVPSVSNFPNIKSYERNITSCVQYRDPLIGVLDYIVEVGVFVVSRLLQLGELRQKCQDRDNVLAIGHDDDLQDIEGVVCQSINKNILPKTTSDLYA
jgi:hypothetical protein